jgi:hypothetical protein
MSRNATADGSSRVVRIRASVLALLSAAAGLACACVVESHDVTLRVPSEENFSAVSSVLELRCGSLDCHGSPARSLRIYGRFGLRENGADTTGGRATTVAEISETYLALVSIDPETLSQSYQGGGSDSQAWLVLSKGTAREQHAGGPALPSGSLAERCVVSWVSGEVDLDACASDSFGPIPRAGEDW